MEPSPLQTKSFHQTVPIILTVDVGIIIILKGCLVGLGLPRWLTGKESACSEGDMGSVPGWGRSPGEGNGNPLQYSCLENPMDRGARRATVHGVAKNWTPLSD